MSTSDMFWILVEIVVCGGILFVISTVIFAVLYCCVVAWRVMLHGLDPVRW